MARTGFDRMEAELRGEQLKLLCDLSTGSRVEVLCHVGHDVAYAKGQVARQTEIDARILLTNSRST